MTWLRRSGISRPIRNDVGSNIWMLQDTRRRHRRDTTNRPLVTTRTRTRRRTGRPRPNRSPFMPSWLSMSLTTVPRTPTTTSQLMRRLCGETVITTAPSTKWTTPKASSMPATIPGRLATGGDTVRSLSGKPCRRLRTESAATATG